VASGSAICWHDWGSALGRRSPNPSRQVDRRRRPPPQRHNAPSRNLSRLPRRGRGMVAPPVLHPSAHLGPHIAEPRVPPATGERSRCLLFLTSAGVHEPLTTLDAAPRRRHDPRQPIIRGGAREVGRFGRRRERPFGAPMLAGVDDLQRRGLVVEKQRRGIAFARAGIRNVRSATGTGLRCMPQRRD
jgi:hypothetical protein